jgi:hydroxypyruvate isomerase
MYRFCAGLGHLFTHVALPERFSLALDSGFDGVELTLPYDYSASALAAVRERTDATVVVFTAPVGDFMTGGQGLGCVPGKQRQFRDSVAVALEYADALQAQWVHFLAGRCTDPARREDYLDVLVGNLDYALDAFAGVGTGVVFEPINRRDFPGFVVSSPAQAREVMARVDGPLGCIFDTLHLDVEGIDPAQEIAEHAACFAHVQLADTPGRQTPGSGTLDWQGFYQALATSSYKGWVGAEYHPGNDTSEDLAWLTAARTILNAEGS